MVLGCERSPRSGPMRLERLPGIHHDSACIIISGTKSTVIIDSGTTWYQSNLVERLTPHLEDRAQVHAILLTHRHFDSCGAAPHLAEHFGARIMIHEDAVTPLAGGDLFTTWASRYDSDMPPIDAQGFSDGEQIDLCWMPRVSLIADKTAVRILLEDCKTSIEVKLSTDDAN